MNRRLQLIHAIALSIAALAATSAEADQLYRVCVMLKSDAACPSNTDGRFSKKSFETHYPDMQRLGEAVCSYTVDGKHQRTPYNVTLMGEDNDTRTFTVHCLTGGVAAAR